MIARLLKAGTAPRRTSEPLVIDGAHGHPAVTVTTANRQGVTLRLHAGHGLSDKDLLAKVAEALAVLGRDGAGLQR